MRQAPFADASGSVARDEPGCVGSPEGFHPRVEKYNSGDWLRFTRGPEPTRNRRGAGELVGAGVIGSALKKLETLQNIVWRLPWSERVAQLHSGQSISEWILAELQREDSKSESESDHVFDKYSTHPSLRDRLAALPAAKENAEITSLPGINLLAQADEVAE